MMGRQQRRAQLLGGAGAGSALLVATGLTVGTWQAWPGLSTVAVAEALGALATGTAALLAWWICAVLVLAVVAIQRDGALGAAADQAGQASRPAADAPLTGRRAPVPPGAVPFSRRVAAWLLAAAAATGTATPSLATPTTVSAQVGGSAAALVGPELLTVTAGASQQPAVDAAGRSASEQGVPEPGWTPTPPPPPPSDRRPAGDVSLVTAPGRAGADAVRVGERAVVVVRAGDTLWDIAARHLGPESTDQDVAEAWPRWYSANLDQIGADPDLILPGQRLVVPTGAGS